MNKKKLSLLSLGGTISMVASQVTLGVVPKLTVTDFMPYISDLSESIDISSGSLFSLPSPQISFSNIMEVLNWCENEIVNGSKGIVITHGTDTIEETAFLLDLLWKHDEPLVLLGAMRTPEEEGADGMSNLRAAILTAASPKSQSRGVLVVMCDRIYEARWIQKAHTTFLDAFTSFPGISGCIHESECFYFHLPNKRRVFNRPESLTNNILLWHSSLSDSNSVLLSVLEREIFHGVVIAGFGAGHVGGSLASILPSIVSRMPVIVCSRTNQGCTTKRTYGWLGSEIDLQNKGAVMGGWLTPVKARILLWVIVSNGLGIDTYEEYLQTMTY